MKDETNSATQNLFRVGDWVVDSDSGYLQREGVEVKLEPKVMQVLVCLARYPGKVVNRETLETAAWSGMVVGYDAISGSIIKLRKALGDDRAQPRYIETISKKGYRLIASVEHELSIKGDNPPLRKTKKTIQYYTVVSIVLIAIILVLYYWSPKIKAPVIAGDTVSGSEKSAAEIIPIEKPSIVVLPFQNSSNDPQQEYFSDGITDDLITGLSRVASLRVIARQSSYHYKNRNINLSEIAKKLDVLYIVEGSVQKVGKRVRINVQLTNIEKGQSIWAERFEGDTSDIFDIQDRIAKHTIDALFVTLSGQEKASMAYRATDNFDAYDAFLLGQQYSKNRTKEGFERSRDAYRNAIKLDANYARAYGALAFALTNAYRFQWTNLPTKDAQDRAAELANKAVLLNNSSPQVYWSLGFVHLFRKEFEQAEAAVMRSVFLSPNYADAYGLLAFIANFRGKADEAVRYIKKATALNPYHTYDYPWNLGLAYYTLGRYTESVKALEDALERNETAGLARLYLAANYIRLGRQDDAEWEIEQAVIQRPDTTLTYLVNALPYEYPSQMNAVLDDLRKAGLPE